MAQAADCAPRGPGGRAPAPGDGSSCGLSPGRGHGRRLAQASHGRPAIRAQPAAPCPVLKRTQPRWIGASTPATCLEALSPDTHVLRPRSWDFGRCIWVCDLAQGSVFIFKKQNAAVTPASRLSVPSSSLPRRGHQRPRGARGDVRGRPATLTASRSHAFKTTHTSLAGLHEPAGAWRARRANMRRTGCFSALGSHVRVHE